MSESQAKSRIGRKSRLFWIIATILIAAGAYLAWQRPWEPSETEVVVEEVTAGSMSLVLAVNGNVQARTEVPVRSAVVGQARSVAAAVGSMVRAGDVLVEIDSSVANAQLAQSRAALEAQIVREEQARLALERARALGSNVPRSNREDAELALTAAANETARLRAALEQSERQREQYTIRAPIDGTILSRDVDIGQLVDTQTELFIVADTEDPVVETTVDEQFSSRVAVGQEAHLLPVGRSIASTGMLIFVAPTVDSATGAREIRIAFDSAQELPIGLTVNANLIVEEFDNAITIPRSAIRVEGAESQIMLVKDGVAVSRPITFHDWPAERVVVTEGLEPGHLLILDPEAAEEGEAVEPVK